MYHKTLTHSWRSPRAMIAAFIAVLLVLAGSVVLGSSAARADVPNPPAATAFNAPLCEGVTTSDPRTASGPVSDLTSVFGQRLTDYNAGRMVVLYDGLGENGVSLPACGTRYVEGVGAVSEWMYCTDFTSHTCSTTDAAGQLTEEGVVVPGMEDRDTNPRLSADQERLIRHLLTTETLMVAADGAHLTANGTHRERQTRQRAIWCVSDEWSELPSYVQSFCMTNLTDAQQQAMLDAIPIDPVLNPTLQLAGGETAVAVGDEARITLETNVTGLPITIDALGATVAVCATSADAATYSGGELLIDAAAGATVSVDLCLTWSAAGAHSVTVGAESVGATADQLHWVQSPGIVGGVPCQVYSAFASTAPAGVSATLDVPVTGTTETTPTGGFTVAKVVAGDAGDAVPTGTEFTVEYSVEGGDAQMLTVTAGGDPVAVSGLDEGDVVTFEEVDLPTIDGLTWGAPVFTVDGEASGTLTIGADETAAIVLTNTADEAATTPSPTPTPTETATPTPTETATTSPTPGPSSTAAAGAGGSDSLAITGGTVAGWLIPTAMVALLGGVVLLALRRRQTEAAEQ